MGKYAITLFVKSKGHDEKDLKQVLADQMGVISDYTKGSIVLDSIEITELK
jgi:hypothetical protein